MSQSAHVRGDRSDHPTKEPTDHANLDPRRHPKHPKIAAQRGDSRSSGGGSGRRSSRSE